MSTYYLLSGEGYDHGTWERIKTDDIANRLSTIRCAVGNTWASAYQLPYEFSVGNWSGLNVETGEVRRLPAHLIVIGTR